MAANEIQAGRYNAILHKLLDMKEGAPAPVLAPEIFPTLQLEGNRPEWAFLAGIRLGQFSVQVGAGGAGVYSMAGVYVPAGSNILCTVDQITTFYSTGGYVFTRMVPNTSIATATGQVGYNRDSRNYGGNCAVQAFFDGQAVVPGVQLDYWYHDGSGGEQGHSITRDVEYVLHPGYGLFVYPTTANSSIHAAFRWRERVFEPSESR